MYMVVFAVELHELGFEVNADTCKDVAQRVQDLRREHSAPIFGHKDQVNMHHENTVSTASKIVVLAHRPKYNCEHAEAPSVQVRTPATRRPATRNAPLCRRLSLRL